MNKNKDFDEGVGAGLQMAMMVVLWTLAILGLGYWLAGGCRHARGQEIPQQRGTLGIMPTAEEIELGRKLFFDPRLSRDGTVSCSTCHDPRKGWADGLPLAVGIGGQVGTRNSPTIINASYGAFFFHDGRAAGLATQALLPEVNPIEMGFSDISQVTAVLSLTPGYVADFANTYGIDQRTGRAVTAERLALAISAFESTIVSFDAPVDRYMAGDKKALTADAAVGFELFQKFNCMSCHTPPLFTDLGFHNNGMEFARGSLTDQGRVAILPPRFRTPDTVRAFKTATLREIHRTAPYGHAGQFKSLERVVQHYNHGGAITLNGQPLRDRFIDQRVKKLSMTQEQINYLVRFLEEGFASSTYPMIEEPMLP